MGSLERTHEHRLRPAAKLIVLAAVATAFAINFWPNPLLLEHGLGWLGNPAYEGFDGMFLPHLLLYSTLAAAVSAALWLLLVRARYLPPPMLGNFRSAVLFGVAGGLASLVLTLLVAWLTFPAGTIHWIDPVGWKIAGNLFSNFFEEFVFRGFVLVGLKAVVGFWPAAVLSSALWAGMHTQYPLVGQAVIWLIGIGFCWLAREARSLWAPYTAHMVLDITADSLIG